MTIKHRRILYISFIIFFLVGAPLIILFAKGYRYNFQENSFKKTGILNIISDPKNADIFLDDKLISQSPDRIDNLWPGKYKLNVTKNGYSNWYKDIEIESGLTTFAENIILFKNNLPINIIDGDINITEISPGQDKLLYTKINGSHEEIRILNLKTNEDFLINELNIKTYTDLSLISWSPSGDQVLIKKSLEDFNEYLIINISSLETKELLDITRLNFDKVIWDQENQNYLYGSYKAILYQINLTTKISKTILSANIQDFQINGNSIFYIEKLANEQFLNKVTINNNQTIDKAEKIKLPDSSQFTLQPSINNTLALLDTKTEDLFLINSSSFKDQDMTNNIILQDKAGKIIWSDDFTKLLYYTDFEISIFNLQNNQTTLITRLGKKIDQVAWHIDNNYLLYVTDNTVKTTQAISGDDRNDIEIAKLQNIGNLAIEFNGENLYFKGLAGNKKGIYKLTIKD